MKKLFFLILTVIFCFSLVACNNASEGVSEPPTTTHTVKIDNQEKFDYYFVLNHTVKNTEEVFGHSQISTSEIKISPRLKDFVDYSGYLILKATSSTQKDASLLADIRLDLSYWGTASDTKSKQSAGEYSLGGSYIINPLYSYSNITYKIKESNITITYHHEGLSGNDKLTYSTISITKYNYSAYLNLSIYNSLKVNDSGYEQVFEVKPKKSYECVEYRHIVITFDNGLILNIGADGKMVYKKDVSDANATIPQIETINGEIDIYPGTPL